MIYFNPDPSAPGTKYYEIEIDDPELTKHGFSRFRLPLNGNATKMILDNTKDRSLITYVDFDRTSLENALKLLEEKLLDEQIVESKAGRDNKGAIYNVTKAAVRKSISTRIARLRAVNGFH
jgi:hypothetical protein